MPRLTKRIVDAALAEKPAADFVVWDDELNGFGLRVRASGSASYVAVYRIGGRKRWFTIDGGRLDLHESTPLPAKRRWLDSGGSCRQRRMRAHDN